MPDRPAGPGRAPPRATATDVVTAPGALDVPEARDAQVPARPGGAGPRDGPDGLRTPPARRWLGRGSRRTGSAPPAIPDGAVVEIGLELPATDPLAGYLLRAARPVQIRDLEMDSPALSRLRESGFALVVPLISAGALIGVLGLGPRRYEREYSTDDMSLLTALAGYAAPALQVAQLVQQHFLPDALPDLPGWQVAACYRPALTVSGDFYDFIPLPGGQALVVIGDVADKGVPAAFVMASTHALLRTAAPRLVSPAAVLGYVNDQLHADLPASMFVTCMALLLDGSGQVRYANAGHDVPYVRTAGGVAELRARGMPLGMMPGSGYEEKTFRFRPGDCALLYSDGISEAHDADREMFGCHRVAELVGTGDSGQRLIDACLAALAAFTGPGHQQEDDITLVCLQRTAVPDRADGSR